MKKLLKSTLVLALTCGIAGAIGIEWGVTGLTLDDNLASTQSPANYGSALDQYVLQLVFVGDGTATEGIYNTISAVQTGSIPQIPFEQTGVVQGSANVTQAGTYVMLIYNNYGGYYALSSTLGGEMIAGSYLVVTQEEIDLGVGTRELYLTNGAVYQGALVPEPSTAALALAGIALLFRRRKG